MIDDFVIEETDEELIELIKDEDQNIIIKEVEEEKVSLIDQDFYKTFPMSYSYEILKIIANVNDCYLNKDDAFIKRNLIYLNNRSGYCPYYGKKNKNLICPCEEFLATKECKQKLFIRKTEND